MKRILAILALATLGALFFFFGVEAPVYFRATDARFIEATGGPDALAREGLNFIRLGKIGAARMFERAMAPLTTPNAEAVRLQGTIREFAAKNPDLLLLGGEDNYLKTILPDFSGPVSLDGQPVIELLLPREARDRARQVLERSRRPGVQEILLTRALTNTVQFPPALSSAGQALETAIIISAILVEEDQVPSGLLEGLVQEAKQANGGGKIEPLEETYLAILSLGKRLNWGALNTLLKSINDLASLKEVAHQVRANEGRLPRLYVAVVLSTDASRVAKFFQQHTQSGVEDLAFAVRGGKHSLETLLQRQQRIYHRPLQARFFGDRLLRFWQTISALRPPLPVLVKYGLVLSGGWLWALAGLCLLRGQGGASSPATNWLAPTFFFATVTVLGAMALSEPFLFQSNDKQNVTFQIQFPMAVQAIGATLNQPIKSTLMIDQLSLFSLLIFFALQVVIYLFCRRRLLEIKREPVSSRLKLKLLENEDHLFDAGLYFGFVGTVISLILVSIGIIRPSLMAAYSSTSFGIIFVSVLKIFYLRPLRRKLIIESESQPA